MKKVIMTSLLASAMFTTGAVSAASSGTITFNGELTANTCDVSVDGQGADATVTLPTVSVSQLDKATKTSGQTGFNMTLSNCSGTLESASAFFEAGPSLDLSTGRLINCPVQQRTLAWSCLMRPALLTRLFRRAIRMRSLIQPIKISAVEVRLFRMLFAIMPKRRQRQVLSTAMLFIQSSINK